MRNYISIIVKTIMLIVLTLIGYGIINLAGLNEKGTVTMTFSMKSENNIEISEISQSDVTKEEALDWAKSKKRVLYDSNFKIINIEFNPHFGDSEELILN